MEQVSAGEMAQALRALAALLEDRSSVPRTHVMVAMECAGHGNTGCFVFQHS